MKFLSRLALLAMSLLAIGRPVAAQQWLSISGSTCVTPGTQYTYTMGGNYTGSTSVSWTCNGGAFVGSSSGTGLIQCRIVWNNGNGGSINVTATGLTGSPDNGAGSLSVTIAGTLTTGTIAQNAIQTINNGGQPAPITIGRASGGPCNANYVYLWQQSTDNSTFSTAPGTNNGLSYTPPTLTQTTYYRYQVTETVSGSQTYSPVATVNVNPAFNGGTIGPASQALFIGQTVHGLGGDFASGGACSGTPTYIWYESQDQANWIQVSSGGTSDTYTPPGSSGIWYYRRQATCSNPQGTETAWSNIVSIDIEPHLSPGSITATNSTCAANTSPGQITGSNSTGGLCSGSYTYIWQQSPDGSNWTTISGAGGQNYTPGNLATNTYYQRKTICGSESLYTNTVLITVTATAGAINPVFNNIDFNTTAPTLTVSGIRGGTGAYTYQWWSQPMGTGGAGSPISGATGVSYSPGVLSSSMSYWVVVSTGGQSVQTSVVLVNVYGQLQGGEVAPATQTVNANAKGQTLYLNDVAGSSGNYSYQWYSNASGSYQPIFGATSWYYDPGVLGATTSFYAVITCDGISVNSVPGIITVLPPLVGGAITPPSQLIPYNTAPGGPLTLSGYSGGNSSYSYQWYSNASGDFLPIANATGTTYTPGALTGTTGFEVVVTSNGASVTTAPALINVTPRLQAGIISPTLVNIPTGTSPGYITCSQASGGGCSGSYSYAWQSSTDKFTWSTVGSGLVYQPGTQSATIYYRLQVSCGSDVAYSNVAKVTIGQTSGEMNYLRSRTLLKPGVTDLATAGSLTSPTDVQQTTEYFDGLGRGIQMVAKQASPLQRDVVTVKAYDADGREVLKYLPYTSSSATDGNYKDYGFQEQNSFNATQFAGEKFLYGQVSPEASPLNRALANFAPGNNWLGAGRGNSSQYLLNDGTDSVHIWNIGFTTGTLPTDAGMYAPGMLEKTITTDEQGHQVMQYKDKEGHILLKKVQSADVPGTAHVGWTCTYYVYDDLNNLRFVISPRAAEIINTGVSWTIPQGVADELCFRYEYDGRTRMNVKKIPGAGEAHMVYDVRDRLVMSQDGNERDNQKWQFTTYDDLDRPVQSGLMTDPTNYNNLTYHTVQAALVSTYPNLASYYNEPMTQNVYDQFNLAAGFSTGMATNVTSLANYFNTTYNSGPTYAMPIVAHPINRGLLMGTFAKVVGSASTYLFTENFYDDRGRIVQVFSTNYTGGVDTVTTQYDFSGKVLATLLGHAKAGNTAQSHRVGSKFAYDAGFRVINSWKNVDGAATDQLINTHQYNELGQLVNKTLGNSLDNLVYEYNIRGWMTGINRDYIRGTTNHYFGLELAYDNATSAAGFSYASQAFNGNIAGLVWKSAGDQVSKRYQFTYDDLNRLTGAGYDDNHSGSGWDHSLLDFTVSGLTYDANGNIGSMNQKGWKMGGSTNVDQLTYTYQANSNKLLQVNDGVNDPNSVLGDFHYTGTKQATDYAYDDNGNLNLDNNKSVDHLTYNYMNLPQQVHMMGKGNISYTYDGAGNKLQKQTVDSAAGVVTTTLYVAGFQYQRRSPLASPSGGTDTVQFVPHEEGRVRWAFHKYTTGDSAYKWEYDFMERDHLGNTRVLLTQQKDTGYYLATMENRYRAIEDALFTGIDNTAYPIISWMGSAPHGPQPDSIVSSIGPGGNMIGPAKLLKVMSGDTVVIGVDAFMTNGYPPSSPTASNWYVQNGVAKGLVSMTGAAHGSYADLMGSSSPLALAVASFLTAKEPVPASLPKAYLNWMLLDNQLNYVPGQSGALPVTVYAWSSLAQSIPLTKSGYLYIWVSNETNWTMFFDNLSITHLQGPMLEENHYYPFGLLMSGISDKALKSNYAENKYRYNHGSELQNKEFSDGSGLETYDTHFRQLDPQLGRWWQIDPKPHEAFSPYASMVDNPMLYSDPMGDTTWVYNQNGVALGVVPDKMKNQVHYIQTDGDPQKQFSTKGLSKKEINALGKSFRQQSIAFIGSKTIGDMHKIVDQSVALKKEVGFVGTVGKDKEIRLSALPVDDNNKINQAPVEAQIDKNYPSAGEQSNLFLYGHTHIKGYVEGYSSPDPQKTFGFPSPNDSQGGDYGNWLYRNNNGSQKGASPALLLTPWGVTTYGSAPGENYSNNSYLLYKSLKQ